MMSHGVQETNVSTATVPGARRRSGGSNSAAELASERTTRTILGQQYWCMHTSKPRAQREMSARERSARSSETSCDDTGRREISNVRVGERGLVIDAYGQKYNKEMLIKGWEVGFGAVRVDNGEERIPGRETWEAAKLSQ